MRKIFASVLCLGLILPTAFSADAGPIAGFSEASARTERDWEAKFRALPDPANMRTYMQRLTAHPHHVGSPYDADNAQWLVGRLKEWGFDAHIENFDVLFPTPKERLLELVGPTHYTAKLTEPAVAQDPTSSQQTEQLPTYNAYSIDGDVTAPLVYVNYGIPEDYELLDRLGISVKGAIVIARYGGSWRGIKPKVAAEHGAAGCLIYSDPHDDGYLAGDVFPGGALRNSDGVQRGSVMDLPLYPGDPLTPGVGATKDAKRLPISQAATLTKIPVLPISYGDAQPLLAALKGPVVPAAWRGGLPITYHAGPGPAQVHLKVAFNWDLKTLYDVVGRIPGATEPDQWVIRGNHHDAWVNGADDPTSGAVAVLEEARGLGELLRQGWKPRRTIIYCLWDGEEPGLLGSTEWAEAHAEELQRHGAVYINSDSNGRGFLEMAGSHTLERFMNNVAREIPDPESNVSVWQRQQMHRIANPAPNASPEERNEPRSRPDLRMSALGSGSDYTAFLDHLGIASLDLGFGGEDPEGIYHSIYDDFYWYTHFADTTFVYGRTLAQTVGSAVLRLADAELLPFEFDDFSDTVRYYIQQVERLAREKHDQIVERNRQLEEGVFAAIDDPRHHMAPPPAQTAPPALDFAPLEKGLAALDRAAQLYRQNLAHADANAGAALARAMLRDVNASLIAVERSLTSSTGLPNRPWFRHQIYAPGFYTGYGVKTLPAVREAIEQQQWKLADEQIGRVGKVLENAGESIQGAAIALERAVR